MITKELIEYIKYQLEKGVQKEIISKNLKDNGWTDEAIHSGFIEVVNQELFALEGNDDDLFIFHEEKKGEDQNQSQNFQNGNDEKTMDLFKSENSLKSVEEIISSSFGVSDLEKKDNNIKEQENVSNLKHEETLEETLKNFPLLAEKMFKLKNDKNKNNINIGLNLEEINKSRNGKTSLWLGGISVFAWIIPTAGALSSLGGIFWGYKGLKGEDKRKARVGLTLSITGFIFSILNFGGAIYLESGKMTLANLKESFKQKSEEQKMIVFEGSDNLGITLFYDNSWQIGDGGSIGKKFLLYKINSDIDTFTKKEYRANISFSILDSFGLDISKYASLYKETLIKDFSDYKILEDENYIINDKEAYRIEGTFSQNDIPLTDLRILVKIGNNIYFITGTALQSAWDKTGGEIKNMVSQIKF